jgi:hypothetical protein
VQRIKAYGLPIQDSRQYAKILSEQAENMFPSLRQVKEKSSRPNLRHPAETLLEVSDVPCYTCRRRHVKCDRILPTCAKCAKKGVQCLGYQKPLRWAEGVAVRGKLKGKSRPVVDSQYFELRS